MKGRLLMRKLNYKGQCEKRRVSKCKDVCKTYDQIQSAYSEYLQNDDEIVEFRCNVVIEENIYEVNGEMYTSDFVCKKIDETIMVRECVFRKHLTKPMTVKLLDASRKYWLKKGITNWGIITNE